MLVQLVFMIFMTNNVSAQLSNTRGLFLFSTFSDPNCVNVNPESGIFSPSSSCWKSSSTSSMKPVSWDNGSSTLTINSYGSSGSCQDNTPNTINNGRINCSGRCQPNTLVPGQYFICLYSNLPTPGNWTLSGYSDNVCRTQTGRGTYVANDICWQTSPTTSVVPIDWNGSNRSLGIIAMPKSGVCRGGTTDTVVGYIPCDGSCQRSSTDNIWYTCTFSSSKFIGLSLALIFALVLLF